MAHPETNCLARGLKRKKNIPLSPFDNILFNFYIYRFSDSTSTVPLYYLLLSIFPYIFYDPIYFPRYEIEKDWNRVYDLEKAVWILE